MNIIDTHCHLDVKDFDPDRNTILDHCRTLGISHIVIPAIEASSWKKLLDLCATDTGLFPALGLHPVFIEFHQDSDLDTLETLVKKQPPVAIGEIGLDFYLKDLDKERQQQVFEQQLELAKKYNLPVILHVRKAHQQVLALLKKHKVVGGIVHAFNGDLQQAETYIKLGFKLGFGGTLTYKNANKIHQLAKVLPLESIVLETDAPDMVTEQHRGERNSPEYIIESLAVLADLRGETNDTIANITTKNASEVLNLDL